MLRFNPHFHAIVLEGGFDDEGTSFYTPFSGLDAMVEVSRRRTVWLLVEKELLAEDFAIKLLGWKHSGFSIDNSVRILDREAQTNLAVEHDDLRAWYFRHWPPSARTPDCTVPAAQAPAGSVNSRTRGGPANSRSCGYRCARRPMAIPRTDNDAERALARQGRRDGSAPLRA